jgi:hypothetical protein
MRNMDSVRGSLAVISLIVAVRIGTLVVDFVMVKFSVPTITSFAFSTSSQEWQDMPFFALWTRNSFDFYPNVVLFHFSSSEC